MTASFNAFMTNTVNINAGRFNSASAACDAQGPAAIARVDQFGRPSDVLA
ncbi:MAG: hypothetical protein R2743_19945 [Ilumatobacteraceae bacterium]